MRNPYIGKKGVLVEHYWTLIEGGESDSSLSSSYTFMELCSLGYYYTVSSALRDKRSSGQTRGKVSSVFVSRFDGSYYEEVLRREQSLGDTRKPYEILNDLGMYSPTGKVWTYMTYRKYFGIKRVKPKLVRGVKKPINYDWYVEVNRLFRSIVDEVGCSSLNAVNGEFVSRGINTKNGKTFTRQCLTYIVERCPEMDWSVRDRHADKEALRSLYYEMFEGVDLGKYSTKKEVMESFDICSSDTLMVYSVLDDLGWRRNTDSWYAYWEGVFDRIRGYLVRDGWLGWNSLSEQFVLDSVPMYNGDDWVAWRMSRLCRKYDFDKDSEYVSILRSYVGDYLKSYVGGAGLLSHLVLDLNARGYVMPNWFGLREASRTRERIWTEELLQRAITEGLL